MAYSATWQNSNDQGRLDAGSHVICLSDPQELAERINRRRLLIYKQTQDFCSDIYTGAHIRQATLAAATAPPFDSFRLNISAGVLSPAAGGLGGSPATPAAMDWLWPVNDGDEGKVLVAGDAGIGEGEIGLFQRLNGTTHWTDPTLTGGGDYVRAVHMNELRQAIEWISRGRWRLPIYFSAGIFSAMPDTPWLDQAVANNGSVDLRSLGYAVITPAGTPVTGLLDVEIRAGSTLTITADRNCTIEARHCLRPLLWQSSPPTWNKYVPSANQAWATPGATGAGDSVLIGSVALTANEAGSISGSPLTSALQAIVDGAEPAFLLRRSDTGPLTVNVSGEVTIELDLDTEDAS